MLDKKLTLEHIKLETFESPSDALNFLWLNNVQTDPSNQTAVLFRIGPLGSAIRNTAIICTRKFAEAWSNAHGNWGWESA